MKENFKLPQKCGGMGALSMALGLRSSPAWRLHIGLHPEAKGVCLGLHPEGKECAWGLPDSRDLSAAQESKQSAQQGWAASMGYMVCGSFSSRI